MAASERGIPEARTEGEEASPPSLPELVGWSAEWAQVLVKVRQAGERRTELHLSGTEAAVLLRGMRDITRRAGRR